MPTPTVLMTVGKTSEVYMKMIQKQLTIVAFPMRAKAVANDSTLMTSSAKFMLKVRSRLQPMAICHLTSYILLER